MQSLQDEKRALIRSTYLPALAVVLLWAIYLLEQALGADWHHLGVHPMHWGELYTLFTGPFIHGSIGHISANSAPLWVLGSLVAYFYRGRALQIVAAGTLFTNVLVFLAARDSYHIGASGVLYFMASFLFFSGIIRKQSAMLAVSLLVSFLYGGLIWGVFPVEDGTSWEGHLMGFVSGIVMAFAFRDTPILHTGTTNEEPYSPDEFSEPDASQPGKIHYHYKGNNIN